MILQILRKKLTEVQRQGFNPRKIIIGHDDYEELIKESSSIYVSSLYKTTKENDGYIFGIPFTISKRRCYLGVLKKKIL